MKRMSLVLATLLLTQPAFAGGLADAIVADEVIVVAEPTSSFSGWIIPLIIVALLVVVAQEDEKEPDFNLNGNSNGNTNENVLP